MKHSRSRGRRRRSGRSRQGIGGIVVRSIAFLVIVTGCVAAYRWISQPDMFSGGKRIVVTSSVPLPSTFQAPQVQARNRRLVYPYSVVPGGVASGAELKEAADHDQVVAQHYSGFDYNHAKLVQVNEPKLVYLSYRKKDKVFWTRKQASLHKGETLLTDGKTIARTRCGNQVSVLPQSNTSPEEPTIAELDRPDSMASGMERSIPGDSDNSLFALDPAVPLTGFTSSSVPPNYFSGGPPPGGFLPMPVGGGVTIPTKPPQNCPPGDQSEKCNHKPPPPPPPVPEPTTIVLVASGAAAMVARMRYRRSH